MERERSVVDPLPSHRALRPGGRVLILGGYGVRNVGDEAILSGMLRQLPPGVKASVVSRSPADTTAMHGVRAIGVAMAAAELARSDMLIVGGGGLFSADTGPFGRFIPAFCRLALMLRKPVAFHGVGVYSSTSPALLHDLATLAPRLEWFTVRDAVSLRTLEAAGVTATCSGDLSHHMAQSGANEAESLLDAAGIDLARPVVGLSLTAINDSLAGFVRDAVPSLIEALPDVQFCFVPMSQHPTNPRHDDLLFAGQLQGLAPRLRIIEGWHHPAAYLELFGRLDAAICSRFHSFLFAHRMQTPIVPLPYSEKCIGWLEEQGVQAPELTSESLIAAVDEAVASRTATRLEVA